MILSNHLLKAELFNSKMFLVYQVYILSKLTSMKDKVVIDV